MNIVVIGGVTSTQLLVEKLGFYGFSNVHVFGYTPRNTETVSGWTDLSIFSSKLRFPFTPFVKVLNCIEAITALKPDLIFAVGLSQLIPPELLALPPKGCVGFHPTALPKGRGRAPIAWLVLEQADGAATFFLLRDGVDDGPILVQEPFQVSPQDDAASVEESILGAESRALDRWLPKLTAGVIEASEQDHAKATWFGRRAPEDGWLDWNAPGEHLLRLIRASTRPYPGAYSYCRDAKITIWRAEPERERLETGVVGRILRVWPDGCFTVGCREGVLRVTEWAATEGWKPRVGDRLGYYVEAEVHALRQHNKYLEKRLRRLEELIGNPDSLSMNSDGDR